MDRLHKIQLEDQVNLFSGAESLEELYQGLVNAARMLGFDYFAFGLRVAVPLTAPRFELLNNYPGTWQQTYHDNGYLSCDPTIKHGSETIMPVLWSEELFSGARPLWEDARSHGLEHGWAQSSYFSSGVSGLLTLARSGEEISEQELSHKTPLLVWFNQLAQVGLHKFLLPKISAPSGIHLTSREAEILRWTADGKTAYEISVILSIAERTVNFHLNNILKKFQVNNKITAAVQAVALGLI